MRAVKDETDAGIEPESELDERSLSADKISVNIQLEISEL